MFSEKVLDLVYHMVLMEINAQLPPCSVADALQALRLVDKVQDANQTTLRGPEMMQAGQYVLTIATSELPFVDVSVNSSHLILQERC